MSQQTVPDVELQKTVDLLVRNTKSETARKLGLGHSTIAHRIRLAAQRGIKPLGFSVAQLDSEDLPVEAIIERRIQQYAHLDKAKKQRLLIPVKVNLDGPIAISHFGDPHLDDDGTDLQKVIDHCNIIRGTEGMFAANIGDSINNWMGRLARLYEEQSTSGAEAWKLCEWFIKRMNWLYFLGGNHGAWSGSGDPVLWMIDHCKTLHDNFSVRLELQFPNGKKVRVNARHDFAGHSMWNSVHGALKAATMGWRDHILICGHLHTSGYAVLKDPSSGIISHAIRVSAYKTWDRYAHEKGLPNQDIFCNAVTVIDPRFEDNDPRLIHSCFDVEQGADYLTWLRAKKAA